MTTTATHTPTAAVVDDTRRQLGRVRWAVRAVLILGVAASLAANMLHAEPNSYSRTIAAWPPLALFATIEVISRVPINHAWLAALRVGATIVIGAIAAWMSYWHMAAVVAHYGEHGATPYLLPISVDGLVIVASISLYELGTRIGHHTTPPPANDTPNPPIPAAPAPNGPNNARRNRHPDADKTHTPPTHSAPDLTRDARPAEVVNAVRTLQLQQPPLDAAQIAIRVGRSKRQVQRIIHRLSNQTPQPSHAINGHPDPAATTTQPP